MKKLIFAVTLALIPASLMAAGTQAAAVFVPLTIQQLPDIHFDVPVQYYRISYYHATTQNFNSFSKGQLPFMEYVSIVFAHSNKQDAVDIYNAMAQSPDYPFATIWMQDDLTAIPTEDGLNPVASKGTIIH